MGFVDDTDTARFKIEDGQARTLVIERQRFAIRRQIQMPAAHVRVAGQGFAGARAIGREAPDFLVPTNIADRIDRFAIRARGGGADPCIFRHRNVDTTARISGGKGCRAARDEDRTRTIRRQCDIIQIVEWFFQPARAALLEIADQIDRYNAICARGEVNIADVGTVLIDNMSVLQLRIAHLEFTERGQRATITAVGGHAP